MKKFIPFIIIFLLIYYVLPLAFVSDIILLAVTPIFLLITAIVFGALFGFSILLAVICAICAIPLLLTSGYIFIVFIIGYFVITAFGSLLGLLFKKKE